MEYGQKIAALLGILLTCTISVQSGAADGEVFVEVTDILQRPLPAKVEFVQQGRTDAIVFRVTNGTGIFKCAPGQYKALLYVYDRDAPVMIDVQEVVVESGIVCNLTHELVEGRLGQIPLRSFDKDGDLALDRVEVTAGTDPDDPASYPGGIPIPWESEPLSDKWDWYAGDLHVRSVHGGGGQQTVAEIVSRAEAAGLDFVAITDRNTVASVSDPAFKSKKVVLVPAMEWGDEARGIALIYGPRTMPHETQSSYDMQGLCYRVQAQGGIFAVGHPCFPSQGEGGSATAPWQWGTSYVNAIEVWCRSYRAVPPISLDAYVAEYHRRTPDDKLIYSIGRAATANTLSANGQAAMFWDYELSAGLRASPIAGSLSSSPDVPIGSPVTYVFAREKSVEGILEGLRLGRTFVTVSKDGPIIRFAADEDVNRSYDVSIGGIIPLNKETQFTIQAIGAEGAKLELLSNGRVIHSHPITTNKVETLLRNVTPTSNSVFRARIVKTPDTQGFGPHEMLAMTGPIYALNIVAVQADKRLQIAELLKAEERSVGSLVSETGESEQRVIFHLQQLDNLGLLFARNEGADRLFRLNQAAYSHFDKSLLTVNDFWSPLHSNNAAQISASAVRDSSGHLWVEPGATAAPEEPEWRPPTEYKTLRPEPFNPR